MSAGSDRLEHLFSRYLDGECTPQERALLESLLRRESEVRAQFDEYRAVDRAVGGRCGRQWSSRDRSSRDAASGCGSRKG